MLESVPVFAGILGLLIGLVVAFAGYRFARGLAALAGFLAGFALGLVLGIVLGPMGMLVAAVVGGIVFALLFVFAFRLVGGLLGGAVAYALAQALGWPMWAVVLSAVVGAVFGLIANKPVIVVATAAEGGWLVASNGLGLALDAGATFTDGETWLIGTAIVVAVLGIMLQMRHLRKHEG